MRFDHGLAFWVSTTLAVLISSCKHSERPAPAQSIPIPTPVTAIPPELAGTWFAAHNEGPLSDNWQKGTFQGEQGFREFRTMVFPQNGNNAVEYTTEVVNLSNEVRQIAYQIRGTLEYKSSPATLIFHAQSGIRRVFSNQYACYRDSPLQTSDLKDYQIVWEKPQATASPSALTYMTATLIDRSGRYSVKYQKASAANASPQSGLPSTTPIQTGPSVKIGDLYYPTVQIGKQEWMATNYAGPGSLIEREKPQYGTFLAYTDLKNISIPKGWRIPAQADFVRLLQSQGLVVYDWGTDLDDAASWQRLGQLMATSGWKKQDGFATNQSGFGAVPADVRRPNGTHYGEGSNCVLWTSDQDSQNNPLVFSIIQMPGSTSARFSPQPLGYTPTLTPLRLVRDL